MQASSRHPLSQSTPSLGLSGGAYGLAASTAGAQSIASPPPPPVMPSALGAADFSQQLQTLFSHLSHLSDERRTLHAQYAAARARRHEMQASLQTQREAPSASAAAPGAVTSPPVYTPYDRPPRAAALSVSIGDLSRSRGRSTVVGSGLTNSSGGGGGGSGPLSISAGTTPTAIEQHSARLRSASLERAKHREHGKGGVAFPRTMLSGASPVLGPAGPLLGVTPGSTPATTNYIAHADDRSAPTSTTTSTPSSPMLGSSPPLDSPSSSGGGLGLADPSLFQATQELFLQLRDPASGLAVRDRRWRFRVIPAAFHAHDAVEWMVARKWALDREDAVTIIQALVDLGVIVSVHAGQTQTLGASETHHTFEDTADDGALYRLKDPLAALGNALPPAAASATAAAAAATSPAQGTDAPSWQFTPMVTQCSVAMLPALARQIASHCAALEASAASATDPTSPPPPTPLPLSTTAAMHQLRTNVLYLCNAQKSMWTAASTSTTSSGAAGGPTASPTDEEAIETLSMEKTFHASAANTADSASATSPLVVGSASSLPVFPYTSVIQKSRGIVNTPPSAFLAELLDLKLRRRWEPLLTSGRVVVALGENTRLLHLLTNMTPLGGGANSSKRRVRPRELLLFQDWFVDTTEQEAAATPGAQPTYILYELSVAHASVAQVPGYRRAEVLLNARIIRPLAAASPTSSSGGVPPPSSSTSPRLRTELTVISQIDFCFDSTELGVLARLFGSPATTTTSTTPGRSHLVPPWFMEKWLGLPSSLALRIPSGRQVLSVLAHSPCDASGGGSTGLAGLLTDEGDLFESHSSSSLVRSDDDALHSVSEEPLTQDTPSSTAASPEPTEDMPLPTTSDSSDEATQPASATPTSSQAQSHTHAVAHASPPPAASVAPAPPSSDPNHIPEFEPLAVLGRGAYSKIIQVRDKETRVLYAMKVLRKVDVVSVGHESHVLTEQAILARLAHPFVCRLFYAFQSQSKLYMVMTYAAGGDLWTLIRRQKLSEELCAFYIGELVLALRYAHRAGVIHRDVKPENILLDHAGHIVLADFGLSHERVHADQRSYSVSGTSEYLSPETILNKGHGPAMDWWQVGVILHELLTGGKHPFYHKNLFRMQQNILHRAPALADTISKDARSLVLALLAKDPSARLGCDADGRDIESHPFFARHAAAQDWGPVRPGPDGVAWERLASKLVPPLYRPKLSAPGDVSHFDAAYTSEPALAQHTPDSVFNSVANVPQSNSLSLARLSLDTTGAVFDTNFNTDAVANDAAADIMGDENEDGELEELMQFQAGNAAATQYSNPSIDIPFQSQHPNFGHGANDAEQPFHVAHPSAQTMLYNDSPALPPAAGAAALRGMSPLVHAYPSPQAMGMHAAPSPLAHAFPPPVLSLPPLPASFAFAADAHANARAAADRDEAEVASLTSQVEQDYFGGGGGGGGLRHTTQTPTLSNQSGSATPAAYSYSNALPHPGLFHRSQSLPNESEAGARHPDESGMHRGTSDTFSSAHSPSPGLSSRALQGSRPTSMLPPPRLNHQQLQLQQQQQHFHGSPISSSAGGECYTSSSSSLPASFRPQHAHAGGDAGAHMHAGHYGGYAGANPHALGRAGGGMPSHVSAGTTPQGYSYDASRGVYRTPPFAVPRPGAHATGPPSAHGDSSRSSAGSLSRSVSSEASYDDPSSSAQQAYHHAHQQQSAHQHAMSRVPYPAAGGAGGYAHGGQSLGTSADEYDEIEAQYLEPNDDYHPPQNGASAAAHVHPSMTPPAAPHTTGFAYPSYPSSASTPVSPAKYAQPLHHRYPVPPQHTSHGASIFSAAGAAPRSPSSRLQQAYMQLPHQQQQQQQQPHHDPTTDA